MSVITKKVIGGQGYLYRPPKTGDDQIHLEGLVEMLIDAGFRASIGRTGNVLAFLATGKKAQLPFQMSTEAGGGHNDPGKETVVPAGATIKKLFDGNVEQYSALSVEYTAVR